MADSSVAITAGSGTPIRVLTALGAGSADQQVITIADSAGNLLGTTGAPLPVVGLVGSVTASTGTITSPALAVTSFTALASNTSRKGAAFFNDSTNIVYLALASTASVTSYTVQIPAQGYYELPGENMIYTGIVTGISAVATGNLRVTELT